MEIKTNGKNLDWIMVRSRDGNLQYNRYFPQSKHESLYPQCTEIIFDSLGEVDNLIDMLEQYRNSIIERKELVNGRHI